METHITPAEWRRTPWKNGLGTTDEIAVYPPGSGVSGPPFLWRLSQASITSSGPFSAFPGYDRTIMLLEGAGLSLRVAGQPARRIDRPFQSYVFSGDEPAQCELLGGPCRDLNLMIDRKVLDARMRLERAPARQAIDVGHGLVLVHVLEDSVRVTTAAARELGAGHSFFVDALEKGRAQLELEGEGTAVVITLRRKGQS